MTITLNSTRFNSVQPGLNINNRKKQPAFGIKLPIIDVLELFISHSLKEGSNKEGLVKTVATLTKAVTGKSYTATTEESLNELMQDGEKVMNALPEHIPGLLETLEHSKKYFANSKNCSPQNTNKWVKQQINKFGEEIEINEKEIRKIMNPPKIPDSALYFLHPMPNSIQ